MIQSVAFIGLGAMGYRMAAHLPKQFSDVRVWNRNFSKAEQHANEFATQAVDLQQAVEADIIFSCLPTSADVIDLISTIQPKRGSIWVDCTSGVPESAQQLSQQLKSYGVDFLDAPVSGQTIGAEQGTLTVMVGGDTDAFARALPAMQCFGRVIQHVGASGAGFAVKAVNNMLMAVNLCAVSEGLTTLKAHGVNLEQALSCINTSSGQSMVSQVVFPQRILNRKFPLTFALPLLAKDTKIALQLAQTANVTAPVLSLTQNLIQIAQHTRPADRDFSCTAHLYEEWNQIILE